MSQEIKVKHLLPEKKSTTALCLSLLLASAGRTPDDSKSKGTDLSMVDDQSALCTQTTLVTPFESPFQSPHKNICPVVDDNFLSQLIVGGSKKECELLLNYLKTIYNLSTQWQQNLNYIFIHIPGFSINLMPGQAKITESELRDALYIAPLKVLSIDATFLSSRERAEVIRLFLHELRHVLWNAVQRKLANDSSNSVNCYFPDTPAEKEKIVKMLAEGNEQILKLEKWLEQEVNGEINPKHLEKLKTLRKQSQKSYQESYKIFFTTTATKKNIATYEKFTGKKMVAGAALHTSKSGPHTVVEVNSSGSNIIIKASYEDPLYAAVYQMKEIQHKLNNYPEELRAFEGEAYISADFPPPIQRFLFRKLCEHTSRLVTTTFLSATPSPYIKFPSTYISPDAYFNMREFYNNELLMLKNPAMLAHMSPKSIEEGVRVAYASGDVEATRAGLKALIQKGYEVAGVNLELANLEYRQKNYKAAATYYKRADKHGANISPSDRAAYSYALFQKGMLKDAKKQHKKSSKSSTVRRGPT